MRIRIAAPRGVSWSDRGREEFPMAFVVKRAYEPASPDDGQRVLVDRLWPRGLSKARARLDAWMKDVAPSPELRMWFDHREDRFIEFERRYRAELARNDALAALRRLGRRSRVTLVYGARDPKINHAIVLKAFLARKR
jgi:uncharacterized protein YeaO (DUF488 family)